MVIFDFLKATMASEQTHLIFTHTITIVIGFILILSLIYLLQRFGWLLSKREPFVFLELKFPAVTSQSSYSTEQLFTLLHSLAGQHTFKDSLLGNKKSYSLEITGTREQGIRYILVTTSSHAPIIEKNLLSYLPDLKIKIIEDYLPADLRTKSQGQKAHLGIIKLNLTNDFILPLKKHNNLPEHDPISYLTGNMTKLESDEIIIFQAVVTPLKRFSHPDEKRHITKIKQRIYFNQTIADELFKTPWRKALSSSPFFVFKIILKTIFLLIKFLTSMVIALWDTRGDSVPFLAKQSADKTTADIKNPYEEELQQQIKEKIDQPMFESSLRLLICTNKAVTYHQRTSGFSASFNSLGSSHQSLTIKKRNLLSLKRRLATFSKRKLSLLGNPILSVSELADIYHFPFTGTTKTEDLVKSKTPPLPAPLSFKQADAHLDNIFAQNSYGGTKTSIGQTLEERRRHTYILGATGSGKTNLLTNMIYNDIINGKGVAVIDPHGDLTEKLLRVIPEERIKDVVWFAPDDDGYPIALNLLKLQTSNEFTSSQIQKQKSLITSSIISIIQKFYDAKFFGPRMEYVLRNTILTALETPNPTLQTILDILTKPKYRKTVVAGLSNKVLQDYWIYEFQKLSVLQRNSVISPITNKIGGLLSSPINYNILSQTKSKIDFEDVINSRKILLCDLSKGKIGEDESSFFGSLFLAKIQLAALQRAHIKENDRKDFYLYVDEFQNFATETFSELVSEARKYRLSTIIAHQSISQIDNRDIVKIIMANVGTVICFRTANPEDEQFILPIFSPEVAKHEISNLPLYNFYMKVSVGQAEDTFLAQASYFNIAENEDTAKTVINQSRKRYATKIGSLENQNTNVIETITAKNYPEKKPKKAGLLP